MHHKMSVELQDLFDRKRVPSWFFCIPLFFYFPLGLCLVAVRFSIGINAFLLAVIFTKLPVLRRFLLRIMCTVLGFIVFVEDANNYSSKVKIVVSNHVTKFDHLAVNLIISTIVPSVWELPLYLTWALGYADFGASQGRQVLLHNVREFMKDSSTPLLIFPEGTTTNGKKGLLKFNLWPFLLSETVQPIRIKVARPKLMQVAFSVVGSRWWSDLFWFLFVPYTVFRIRFLPVAEKEDTESAEMFCNKVQKQICKELGLEATTFTSADKVEYTKYILKEDGKH